MLTEKKKNPQNVVPETLGLIPLTSYTRLQKQSRISGTSQHNETILPRLNLRNNFRLSEDFKEALRIARVFLFF